VIGAASRVVGALLLLGVVALGQESLRYAPEEGMVLRRKFEVKHFLALKRSVTRIGELEEVGQRVFDVRNVEKLQTSDRILSVGDGRPLSVRRYFDRGTLDGFADLSGAGGAINLRALGLSRLKGKSVMFTWIPKDGAYGRYFDAMDGVEEDLGSMREDLDLRLFLPEGAVEVGASWSVPAHAMGDALSPGGMLSFDFSKSKNISLARTMRLGTASHLFELFTQEVGGEVSATLLEVEESEGARVAVVKVTWDVKTQTDLTELAMRNRASEERRFGQGVEEMSVGLELKGEGIFRWDLGGHHLLSYDFSSAEDVASVVKTRVDEEGPLREEVLEMGGRVIVSGTVERRER
jgi:hypothetical protein